jgi:hypothetical protein
LLFAVELPQAKAIKAQAAARIVKMIFELFLNFMVFLEKSLLRKIYSLICQSIINESGKWKVESGKLKLEQLLCFESNHIMKWANAFCFPFSIFHFYTL